MELVEIDGVRTNDQMDCGPPHQKNPYSWSGYLFLDCRILPELPEYFVYVLRLSVIFVMNLGHEIFLICYHLIFLS